MEPELTPSAALPIDPVAEGLGKRISGGRSIGFCYAACLDCGGSHMWGGSGHEMTEWIKEHDCEKPARGDYVNRLLLRGSGR